MRVLLVEDDRRLASLICRGLQEEGYAVDVAYDGDAGLATARAAPYDVLILDIMLPKRDGIEVLRQLREWHLPVPVLLLTAKDSTRDRVAGLNAGADDYLVKPFDFDELLARVRALLRRAGQYGPSELRLADLVLDPLTHEVMRGGEAIPLTPKEFALLEYLVRNPDRVLTRTAIAEHVWDMHFAAGTNVVDVHMGRVRRKIDGGSRHKLIHTVRGVGYIVRSRPAGGP